MAALKHEFRAPSRGFVSRGFVSRGFVDRGVPAT
jgi:hypothetical protein